MPNKDDLKKHASRLEKHIAEYGGGHTESSLMADSWRHEEEGHDKLDNNELKAARRHFNKASDMADASSDVHAAHEAVKKYGQGHDMSLHGEGKPYGG